MKPLQKKYSYIKVYETIRKELNLNYSEYCVIDQMLFYSRGNEFSIDIKTFSNKFLCLERKTTSKIIKRFIDRGFLSIEDEAKKNSIKTYFIHYDIDDIFNSPCSDFYLKIYPKHASELNANHNFYAFIYLCYSLSRKNKDFAFYTNRAWLGNKLGVVERTITNYKRELVKKQLVTVMSNNYFKMNDTLVNWFILQEKFAKGISESIPSEYIFPPSEY